MVAVMPLMVLLVIPLVGCSGISGTGITSSAPSSPDTVALRGTAGSVCGKPDDRLVHVPPSYTLPLAPPVGIGQTLVDPQYGCVITRLTTFGEFQASQSNHHNY